MSRKKDEHRGKQHLAQNELNIKRGHLFEILNGTFSIVCAIKPDGTIVFVNQAIERVTGYKSEDLCGKKWWKIFYPKNSFSQVKTFLDILEGGSNIVDYEMILTAKNGQERLIVWNLNALKDDFGNFVEIIGFGLDVTNLRKVEKALRSRLRIEKMLTDISTQALSIEDLEIFFQKSLGIMGDTLDVCRIYIFEHCHKKSILNNTFEWVSPGIVPQKENLQNILGRDISWWIKTLKSNKTINYSEIEKIPSSRVREMLKLQGIKSILVVPLFVNGEYHGFMGFDECRFKRFWLEEDVNILKAISHIFARKIENKKAEEERLKNLIFFQNLGVIEGIIRQKSDLEEMLKEVLKAVFEIFNCDRSWLLYPCNPKSSFWRVPMEYAPEYPGAYSLGRDFPMTPDMAEMFRRILRENDFFVFDSESENQFPEKIFKRFSVRSQIVMAIYPKSGDPWIFGIHQCSRDRVWSSDEQALFKEIGNRITGALSNLIFLRDLQKSEQAYRTLAEKSPDVIMRFDRSLRHLYVSPSIKDNINIPADDFVGKTHAELGFPLELVSLWERVLKNVFITGEQQRIEFQLPNGKWMDWIVAPEAISDNREVQTVVTTARDNTEVRLLKDQLAQACKMEAIGTLAGGIAHDFNNILAGILGFTELCLLDAGDELRPNLQKIAKASKRARDLVKQILAFSRKNESEKKPINIDLIVKEVLKMLRATLPANIEIKQFLSPGPFQIVADPTQIHQVVTNLCTNAFHAMEDVGGVLKINLISCEIESDTFLPELDVGLYAKLSIEDTGCGIKPEEIDKIFDPYYTTKGKDKGTGLGLSVVHGIVKSHDGAIKAKSVLGQGTIFDVYLPKADSSVIIGEENKKQFTGGTECIMFIDDEDYLREVAVSFLGSLGYQVKAFKSPVKAIEAFKVDCHNYDMVITDLTMRGMTGNILVKEMFLIKPDIPIILCTGFSEKIDEEAAKKMGIKSFLIKPVAINDLAKAVREILDS